MNRSRDDNGYPTAFALLDTAPPSLVGWFADPLDATDAADLLLQVEASQQTCLQGRLLFSRPAAGTHLS